MAYIFLCSICCFICLEPPPSLGDVRINNLTFLQDGVSGILYVTVYFCLMKLVYFAISWDTVKLNC